MPDISRITLPSGTTYDIKDSQARSAKGWIGITSTELEDGSTTNPITIGSSSVTAAAGDITSYNNIEFIFNGTFWQEFGDLSDLGELAYVDTAVGKVVAAGTVSKPEVTITPTKTAIPNVTSVGSMPTFTVANETLTIGAGAVPTLGTSVEAFTAATAELSSAPVFTGTSVDITVSAPEDGV